MSDKDREEAEKKRKLGRILNQKRASDISGLLRAQREGKLEEYLSADLEKAGIAPSNEGEGGNPPPNSSPKTIKKQTTPRRKSEISRSPPRFSSSDSPSPTGERLSNVEVMSRPTVTKKKRRAKKATRTSISEMEGSKIDRNFNVLEESKRPTQQPTNSSSGSKIPNTQNIQFGSPSQAKKTQVIESSKPKSTSTSDQPVTKTFKPIGGASLGINMSDISSSRSNLRSSLNERPKDVPQVQNEEMTNVRSQLKKSPSNQEQQARKNQSDSKDSSSSTSSEISNMRSNLRKSTVGIPSSSKSTNSSNQEMTNVRSGLKKTTTTTPSLSNNQDGNENNQDGNENNEVMNMKNQLRKSTVGIPSTNNSQPSNNNSNKEMEDVRSQLRTSPTPQSQPSQSSNNNQQMERRNSEMEDVRSNLRKSSIGTSNQPSPTISSEGKQQTNNNDSNGEKNDEVNQMRSKLRKSTVGIPSTNNSQPSNNNSNKEMEDVRSQLRKSPTPPQPQPSQSSNNNKQMERRNSEMDDVRSNLRKSSIGISNQPSLTSNSPTNENQNNNEMNQMKANLRKSSIGSSSSPTANNTYEDDVGGGERLSEIDMIRSNLRKSTTTTQSQQDNPFQQHQQQPQSYDTKVSQQHSHTSSISSQQSNTTTTSNEPTSPNSSDQLLDQEYPSSANYNNQPTQPSRPIGHVGGEGKIFKRADEWNTFSWWFLRITVINVCLNSLLITAAIVSIALNPSLSEVFVGLYVTMFALVLILVDMQFPTKILNIFVKHMGFLYHKTGRITFQIFMGFFCVGLGAFGVIVGLTYILWSISLLYVFYGFDDWLIVIASFHIENAKFDILNENDSELERQLDEKIQEERVARKESKMIISGRFEKREGVEEEEEKNQSYSNQNNELERSTLNEQELV